MKKLFSFFFISILTIPLLGNKSKADVRFLVNQKDNMDQEIIKMTSTSDGNTLELLTTWDYSENNNIRFNGRFFDSDQNKLYFQQMSDSSPFTLDKFSVYDITNDSWSTETLNNVTTDSTPNYQMVDEGDAMHRSEINANTSNISTNTSNISTNTSNISTNDTDISALQGLLSTKSGSTTTTRVGDSTKNTLEIGGDTNPTTINQEGISVGGSNLIKKQSNGDIHIGKNSFVIGNDVLDGAHPIWAEDENGTKIPLNIYGSDLQINGVSVQGQINSNKTNIKNLGEGVAGSTALTAALTALPQTSKDSKLSCGLGTGAYSSRYAVGFGCASKLNERVDVNAGGSYVFDGSKSYGGGTLDSGVVKAGFVFKLGELNKPTQLSLDESKELKKEVKDLKAKNDQLLARLEKLENIASRFQSSSEMISVATKD